MSYILNELIGRIVNIQHSEGNTQIVFLEDADESLFKIRTCLNVIYYVPISKIEAIELSKEEEIKKFVSYVTKKMLDPSFQGDENNDKGYKVFKRKKEVKNG